MADETSGRKSLLRRYGPDVLIVVAVLVGLRWWQAPDVDGDALPPLQGVTLQGERVRLADAEGPTVLYFWATWCGVCGMTAPGISALAEDTRVITVASQSGADAEVAAYMKREGLAWRVVNDPGGELARRFGVRGFPTTFVLDRAGRAVATEVGYTTEWGLRARAWWAGL